MSGRAIGLANAVFAGVRVAGELTWIPAHTKNGVKINSRCIIPVYRNSHRGKDQKTGEKGRSDSFRLVAWGKLADTCAKSLAKGNAIDVICEPHSYLGKVFNQDGSPRLDVAGQPIEVNKVAFTILNIVFGEESDKHIDAEVMGGRRPPNWNVKGHPNYDLWIKMLHDKQAQVWDGRNPKFGEARVVVPQGHGIVLDFTQPQARTYQAPLENQIATAFGATLPAGAKFNPNTGQPIVQKPMFDPMTGQPINQPTAPPAAKFDPYTGQPISAPASYAPPTAVTGGTILY
jgi:hypothetical protein